MTIKLLINYLLSLIPAYGFLAFYLLQNETFNVSLNTDVKIKMWIAIAVSIITLLLINKKEPLDGIVNNPVRDPNPFRKR